MHNEKIVFWTIKDSLMHCKLKGFTIFFFVWSSIAVSKSQMWSKVGLEASFNPNK